MYTGLHVNYPIFLSHFKDTRIFSIGLHSTLHYSVDRLCKVQANKRNIQHDSTKIHVLPHCPAVPLLSYTHNTKQKIWIPNQATEWSSSWPVQDPGLPRRGISKQQFWSQSLNGIFNCSRLRSNTERRCMAARLQGNSPWCHPYSHESPAKHGTGFRKVLKHQVFMKIQSVGAELLHADRRTWRSWQFLFAVLRTHLNITCSCTDWRSAKGELPYKTTCIPTANYLIKLHTYLPRTTV
jgi:hypothetical protein